jgi:hypothetical protein
MGVNEGIIVEVVDGNRDVAVGEKFVGEQRVHRALEALSRQR